MAGRFEVYPDRSGKYRFRAKASNGHVVAVRRIKTKAAAGARSVSETGLGGYIFACA
jgi:uncharacterized protein YegP (UPF0339 family)